MMTSWRRKVLPLASVLMILVVLAVYIGNRHILTAKAASGCTVSSSLPFNFKGNAIPAGDVIWFTSILHVNGLPASLTEVDFQNQTIQFAANGQNYTLAVPSASVQFDPNATSAATTTLGQWQTTVPSTINGNTFLSGYAFTVPAGGLPAAINPVTWSGQFVLPTNASLTVNWQWTASVYSSFNWNYSQLGVKPVDDSRLSQYQNSDRAGTPENFKSFVTSIFRVGRLSSSASATANEQCNQSNTQGNSPVAAWNDQVTFTSGPFNGQNATTIITFNSDGTLTETTTGPTGTGNSTGIWYITGFDQNGNTLFTYIFDEPQSGGGVVHVSQSATLSQDNTQYTSSGGGQFIINGQVVGQATTTTQATHL